MKDLKQFRKECAEYFSSIPESRIVKCPLCDSKCVSGFLDYKVGTNNLTCHECGERSHVEFKDGDLIEIVTEFKTDEGFGWIVRNNTFAPLGKVQWAKLLGGGYDSKGI